MTKITMNSIVQPCHRFLGGVVIASSIARTLRGHTRLVLTVVSRGEAMLSFQAGQCDVENDVQQQEGEAGEAQGLEQPPCVSWGGSSGV